MAVRERRSSIEAAGAVTVSKSQTFPGEGDGWLGTGNGNNEVGRKLNKLSVCRPIGSGVYSYPSILFRIQ